MRSIMFSWTVILSLLAGALGIYYFFRWNINKLKELGIVHMKPLPILGNMGRIVFRQSSLVKLVDTIYKLNEEAAYVGFYDFGDPVIVIRSPELIKDITIKHFDHFVDHRTLTDPSLEPLLGKNLFSLSGDKWKEVRSLLSPAFTSSKMKAMFQLMSDCGKSFAEFLSEQSVNAPNVLDMKDAFARYTNDVIATCAFGIDVDSMRNPENDFYVLGSRATNFDGLMAARFFMMRMCPGLCKLLRIKIFDGNLDAFFEGVVRTTMETRDREGITRPDMIQLMMEARGKKIGEGGELSIQDMTAQAFIFFFGGFDSSSSLMCFVAYLLAVNTDVQKRLQEEVDKVTRETNGDPNYDAINSMQYLDAVINETLRMYPFAIFLDRKCVKTFELPPALPGGRKITIQPGQGVWVPINALHKDPKYFPNPEEFEPERFMGDRKNDIDPLTYLPFGVGPRMCIGNRFALLEAKVVIFHLLSKCHIEPSPKTLVPLELMNTFKMMPKGGFWLQLESRQTTLREQKEKKGLATSNGVKPDS